MIQSFRHKPLAALYASGQSRGLNPEHVERLRLILSMLDVARGPDDLRLPSFRLHALSGDRRGQWAITVRANWRVVFSFDGDNVVDVDYVDYH